MYRFRGMRAWVQWPLVRAHLCTLATSVSLHATWRGPRLAFRFGGLQFALVLTAALALATPVVLLQLALGQLSQQDAVGVWRAVPFFKGVGYIRLLVSFVGCVYTAIHVALTIAYFLYTLSNAIPFEECTDLDLTENGTIVNIFNASDCLSATFLAPVGDNFEYYLSMCLIILFIWIALPFLLYSPVKLMKRIFYPLGPVLVVGGVVVASAVGSGERLAWMHRKDDWSHLTQPYVWLAAVAQALLTTQVAGGYLISAGDSVYSSTNVQWTSIALVCTSILASWFGLLFWYVVAGGEVLDTSSAAVLTQMYQITEEEDLPTAWTLLVFAALLLSGVITMLTFLYPIYDRIRRSGGPRWRVACAAASAAGAALAMATLAGGDAALAALEDAALPLLICVATVLELLAFVFIYGWKALKEDVEFLIGQDVSKLCVLGWCAAPGVVVPLSLWWLVVLMMDGPWEEPPWSASTVVATGLLILVIIVLFAIIVVTRQVQYDIIGKLKSSFRPSRHWGPRDPITHYYWLARREEAERAAPGAPPRPRYVRRQVGQLSGAPSFLNLPAAAPAKDINSNEVKRRSNSDDWIYTVYRRKYLEDTFAEYITKSQRSMSLEWGKIPRVKTFTKPKVLSSVYASAAESVASDAKDNVK